MKVLVLGGSRYIGRRLVDGLIAAGHQVLVYNRGRRADGFLKTVERARGDRRSAADLAAALSGRSFDAAFDFLCYDASDARLAVEALSGKVGHFVHISTCSVYWCTGDFPCPVPEEDFDRLGDFDERPGSIEYAYGYAKRKAEEALFAAYRETGFPVTAIRMPIVGGEDDYTLRYASYCERIADGGPLIVPDGGYAPFRHVYVGDAADALASLAGSPGSVGQAYNLACAEILSVRTVIGAIADLLGRRPETVEVPSPVLGTLMPGVPPSDFSPFSQQAAQVPAIGKARRDLGWSPTPWAEWLERAVRWAIDTRASRLQAPPALAWRSREIEAIDTYRTAILSCGAGGGTSSAPPG